jgi:hypothetical protein
MDAPARYQARQWVFSRALQRGVSGRSSEVSAWRSSEDQWGAPARVSGASREVSVGAPARGPSESIPLKVAGYS